MSVCARRVKIVFFLPAGSMGCTVLLSGICGQWLYTIGFQSCQHRSSTFLPERQEPVSSFLRLIRTNLASSCCKVVLSNMLMISVRFLTAIVVSRWYSWPSVFHSVSVVFLLHVMIKKGSCYMMCYVVTIVSIICICTHCVVCSHWSLNFWWIHKSAKWTGTRLY